MTDAGEIVITAPLLPHPGGESRGCAGAAGGTDREGPCAAGQTAADQAEPGRQGEAGRQQEAARLGQGGTREGEAGLMYDFKIDAADKPSLYARAGRGGRRADRRRAGRDRQHGQCRRPALGDAARSQLGRLLPQCRRRTGARPLPGPAGLHPHPLRQGRVRHGRGEPGAAMRRRRPRLSRPYRLRCGEPRRSWSCRSSRTAG